MPQIGETYADGRARISQLLAGLTDDEADAPVPACPAWTVHDVAAHLVGGCADILAGNIEGVASEAWTAAQVEARKGASVSELLAEWAEVGPQVEAFADAFPGRSGHQWITDQTTHEHDIRGALLRPGGRDSTGLDIALDFLVGVGFDNSLSARGLGPIEVRAGDRRWVVGSATPTSADPAALLATDMVARDDAGAPPDPVAAVEAPPFELFRALSGRRSVRQIETFDWSVDPSDYIVAFRYGPFVPSPTDLVE